MDQGTEALKKCDYLRPRVTPSQLKRIQAHCRRLDVSMSSRVLELLRRDILEHRHFDLSFDLGPIRRPRRAA